MSRFLRYGLLGLALAVPFAMPQSSQAAAPAQACVTPARSAACRPAYRWQRYHAHHVYYGRHVHRYCR